MERKRKARRGKTKPVVHRQSARMEERHSISQQLPSSFITENISTNRYIWTPVDRTRKKMRILDLDAGVPDSPLRGRLRNISLEALTKPTYETISYAWGDTALVQSIFVDDKTMAIPASAALALRCMRLPEKHRSLWIDCICVDQDNNLEKGHQVRLMAEIYVSSSCTLAFISNDEALGQRAFHSMISLCNSLGKEHIKDPERDGISKRTLQVLHDDLDWTAIRGILSMPYFG
jgi:hypothetical protein